MKQHRSNHLESQHKQLGRLRDDINNKQKIIDELSESVISKCCSLIFLPPSLDHVFTSLFLLLSSENQSLVMELQQLRAEFVSLKSQECEKSARLEELKWVFHTQIHGIIRLTWITLKYFLFWGKFMILDISRLNK